MKEVMTYKGYSGSVNFCPVDNILYGKLLGISDSISYHADDVAGLRTAFEESVEDYFEVCKEMGKEPQKARKGACNVRISHALHQKLAVFSKTNGKTLNAVVEEAIKKHVA